MITVTVSNTDIIFPAISMTAPANGATVSGSATTLSATASDNVGVVGVQFKVDGANLGTEDVATPYAKTWDSTTFTNGSHTLTAVARDAAGNSSTSTAVTVTVSNAVTSSSTIWNASATPNHFATSDANAVELGVRFRGDTNGTISALRFYKGATNTGTHIANLWSNTGTLLATATFANETASGWQQVTFGSPVAVTANTTYIASYHTATGQYGVDLAYFASTGADNAPLHALQNVTGSANSVFTYGAASAFPTDTYQSSNYWVDVVFTASGGGDTTAPAVAITAPSGGASVSGNAVTVSATASDNVGVVGVQFKLDGANLGAEDPATAYSLAWNTTTATNGSHTLTAVARDAAGNTTTSTPVSVTVSNTAPDTTPPTVSMTAPANGASVSGSAVTVSATASDNVGIVGVQFKLDGANLGAEDPATAYSLSWNTTTVATGSHTLTAVARDAAGNTTTAATVTVTVTTSADTTAPTASITAPANGATVSGTSVSLSATAADNVGVVGVQFKVDGANLGTEDTATPYTKTWDSTTVSNGTHTLTVVARDAAGNTTTSASITVTKTTASGNPSTQPLLQQSSLSLIGTFKVPSATLGSTYGFGAAGTGGLGTYAMAFNTGHNSIFLGGHPYEQRIAELAIPASLTGSPTATALSNLIDPLEGRLGSINPSDPNSKIIGSALVYNNQLFIGAFSYYDGAGTQTKSEFSRPLSLSTTGQVTGPVKVGSNYPGWVDKYAALIPPEWQALFGGPAFAGGTLGAINSLQSWGPSATVFNPTDVNSLSTVPGTIVLGYPYGSPLADTTVGNQYLSQADFITGMAFPVGTRSVLFFGKHGLGNYCYGTGGSSGGNCYDPDDGSKGIHSYPYRSQVWAYDANDLIAVKNGQVQSYQVMPYAVWQLGPFVDVQGVAYDPTTQRLYVSQVYADATKPLINVFQIVP